MAKITRATHKTFGGSGSSDNFSKFGSLVAGAPIKTKDIATIQALPAWDDGFQDAIYGANKNLLLEDLNSFAFEHSRQVAYLFQAGVAEWDSATEYSKGSIVQRTDGSGNATAELYYSNIDGNIGNAIPVQATNANWTYMNAPSLPVGSSLDYMGIGVPVGFLWEDGTAYSRATYAALFASLTVTLAGNLTIGSPIVTGIPSTTNLKPGFPMSGTGVPTGAKVLTVDSGSQVTMTLNATSTQTPSAVCFAPHGVGDGATTFNVPDTRRRATVGAGGAATSVLDNALGAVGGEETHTLTIAEMPSHDHSLPTENATANLGGGGGVQQTAGGNRTGFTGGDGAHNNIQPSLVCTKIIKF